MDNGGFLGFDASTIDMEALRFVFYAPAYQDVFVPFLRGIERGLSEQLLDPTQERKWAKNDDYLRGGIICIRALLTMPEQLIDDEDHTNEQEAMLKRIDANYQERADSGHIGPMGFTYSAEEEF